ncbi:MAG: glycosyltransferase [Phycisphaerae bacterium]|nr:glycosyltransferase [Gemmatimonadaceae bacterium]
MAERLQDVRIALVHEWLVTPGGSEQVLREMKVLYPQADVFCLVDKLTDADRRDLGVGHPTTSFLQRLPRIGKVYRKLLPLMPAAVEALDLSAYDLVISNSHAVAKGARVRPGALHICHCCSPMRYAWDLRAQYLEEAGLDRGVKGWLAERMLDRLKRWDLQSSSRVHQFIAISDFIADRIQRAYRRDSTVLYPPVDTEYFTPLGPKENYYVAASRFVSYKRIPAIVEAFRALPDHKLIVIGTGPEWENVQAVAGSNVTLMGWQPRDVLRDHLRKARAFLFAAEEDFGILPVEAQACGTPVIALGVGGALETVVSNGEHPTGAHFHLATPAGIAAAIRAFEEAPAPDANDCRQHAEKFSVKRFHRELDEYVSEAWRAHSAP